MHRSSMKSEVSWVFFAQNLRTCQRRDLEYLERSYRGLKTFAFQGTQSDTDQPKQGR